MDIERLKELKEQLASKKFDFYGRHNIRELIDEAIARQSVKSEEVAEAIDDITERIEWECTVHGTKARRDKLKMYDLELQALRQMRSEPCWYCKGIEAHRIKSVKAVTDELGRDFGAYDTPYKFCPNCGRPLPEPPKEG